MFAPVFIYFSHFIFLKCGDDLFWLPSNLDFRGRAYPLSAHFSHVSSDPRRAMLKFAKGRITSVPTSYTIVQYLLSIRQCLSAYNLKESVWGKKVLNG